MNESVPSTFQGAWKEKLKIQLGKEKQQKIKHTTDEDELRSQGSEVIAPTSL